MIVLKGLFYYFKIVKKNVLSIAYIVRYSVYRIVYRMKAYRR